MKLIPLTKGLFAKVDDVDWQHVGLFTWHAHKSRNKFYAITTINYKSVLLHRFIMGVTDPNIQVDHADSDPLNNQRNNLRICNNSQNQMNRESKKESIGARGTIFDKGRWRAAISVNGKRIYIGAFGTQKEAALAYNEAAIKYHGEFARLNTIAA